MHRITNTFSVSYNLPKVFFPNFQNYKMHSNNSSGVSIKNMEPTVKTEHMRRILWKCEIQYRIQRNTVSSH